MAMITFGKHRGPWHATAIRGFSVSVKARAQAGTSNPTQYCKDLVQKHDYEGYLTSRFYPREYQSAFYALRAFYVRALRRTVQ